MTDFSGSSPHPQSTRTLRTAACVSLRRAVDAVQRCGVGVCSNLHRLGCATATTPTATTASALVGAHAAVVGVVVGGRERLRGLRVAEQGLLSTTSCAGIAFSH
jgi:hypothetical protein